MRLVVLVLTALLVRPAAAEAAPHQRLLNGAQVRADVALAREAFERVHMGYDRYADPDALAAAWEAVVARGRDGMSVGRFYLEIQAVLAMLRCDHTKAELPAALAEARRTTPVYLPMGWDIVAGRAFVMDAAASGLARHDEILAIDGQPISALIERYAPLIPVDGFTDAVRERQLAHSGEFMGGGIEHFMALEGELSPRASLGVRRADGALTTIEVPRVDFEQWRELVSRTRRYRMDFVDSLRFERLGDDAAYLAVDSFVNYRRPVDPDGVYAPVFRALASEGRTRLILDLRRNGGGSDDAMRRLFAHLIDDRTRLHRPSRVKTLDLDGLREHLDTWEKRALNPRRWQFRRNDDGSYSPRWFLTSESRRIRPARHAFDGELIVLAGRDNSSASTNLIAKLQDMGRATVVGEATGGSAEGPTAGVLFFLTLPHSGVVARLPALRGYNDVGKFTPGMGVLPDVPVPVTVADFLAGRDAALEAARRLAASPCRRAAEACRTN